MTGFEEAFQVPYRPPPLGPKQLRVTGPARGDMDATLAHLAADAGLDVADQFADRLDADLLKLAATGHAGVSRDWISHGLRLTVIGNFSVYFRVTETETIILRVLRGSRDISRVAFDEG